MKKKKLKKRTKIKRLTIQNSKYFIPQFEEDSYTDIKTNTWFDIKQYSQKATNKYNCKIEIEEKERQLRASQVKLQVSDFQKNIILKWIEISRTIYNLTIYYFRKHKVVGFRKVRPIIKNNLSKDIKYLIKKFKMPQHIIDNSINDVCKAYNTAFENLKAGNISHFLIGYKSYSKNNQTIVIENSGFSLNENGFYKRYLTENKKFTEFITTPKINLTKNSMKHNVRLTYLRDKDQFILNIPTDRKLNNNKTNNKCFIDCGNKTFLTIYNPNGECYKLYNRKNRLMNLIKRRKKLKSFIDESYGKKYNIVIRNPKLIKNFKKVYNRLTNKIQNLVKELHYKSANFLCKKFDQIFLGKLSMKGVTKKSNNMNPNEKCYTYAISHDKFRTILKNQIDKFKFKELKVVDESFTTKTCGNCGIINNKVGRSRVFNCNKCNYKIDRDFNSARLIGIKNE